MSAPEYVLVLTTLPADGDVTSFATALVEERLAACVSASAEVKSIYRWEGRIEEEHERQITIKTTRDILDRLWLRVRELHPYEVPEFLVLPVIDGSDVYLKWIRASTTAVAS